jgi:hypothetical protein
MTDDEFQPLYGARAIAAEAKVPVRRAFYLLERGLIRGHKLGATWVSNRRQVREDILGVIEQPERKAS